MEKQSFSEYPYGQFPTKFTKHGQKEYFEQLNTEQKISTMNTSPPSSQSQPVQNNSFDIAKLLPLLKMMGDKKSMSSTDMLQMFLPLLGGGNTNNISEIMSLINPSKSNHYEDMAEDIIPPTAIKIDDYKRVE